MAELEIQRPHLGAAAGVAAPIRTEMAETAALDSSAAAEVAAEPFIGLQEVMHLALVAQAAPAMSLSSRSKEKR